MNVGVGDFIAVGRLAWDVYKAYGGAPDSFKEISIEILSLHALLKEVEESVLSRPTSPTQEATLKTLYGNCSSLLEDLNIFIKKYDDLPINCRLSLDRARLGMEDIDKLRSRITGNVVLLTGIISTSQLAVVRKLEDLLRDYQNGHREGSIASVRTVESLGQEDKKTWRMIRKELEDVGITVEAFNANKTFIIDWFTNAFESGAFEERVSSDERSTEESKMSLGQEDKEVMLNIGGVGRTQKSEPENVRLRTSVDPPEVDSRKSITTKLSKEPSISIKIAASRKAEAQKIQQQRKLQSGLFKSLAMRITRVSKNFSKAVTEGDILTVKEILQNDLKASLITNEELNWGARQAIIHNKADLANVLGTFGADIDFNHKVWGNALTMAAFVGAVDSVRLLLDKGFDVNQRTGLYRNPLYAASANGWHEVVQLLIERGADVNQPGGYREENLLMSRYMTNVDMRKESGILSQGGHFGNALQAAIASRSFATSLLLVENGADINVRYGWFGNALSLACFLGPAEIVRLLLDSGADVNQKGGFFGNALQAASIRGYYTMLPFVANISESVEIVELLLNHGARVNAQGGNFHSALRAAIFNQSHEIVELLIQHGASTKAHGGQFGRIIELFRNYQLVIRK